MSQSPVKLRRCPFCGGRPSLAKGKRYKKDGLYPFQKAGEWVWPPGIKCGSCNIGRDFDSVEEAIKWWSGADSPVEKPSAPGQG